MKTTGVGFPVEKPRYRPYKHGWFLQTHINVFTQLITPEVKVIVEIGSWYGSSTKWLAETADTATIYAIDLWDDNFILQDNHYASSKHDFLRDHPLYPTFLVNLWDHRDRVIPLRMDGVAGLEYLKAQGVTPEIIYIDADHHYAAVKRDVQACMRLFPDAILVGDDYGNYEDVRRAVNECAAEKMLTVHVDSNHCWTYSALISNTGRNIVPKPSGEVAKRKFSDFLSIYATGSKAASKRKEDVIKESSTSASSSSTSNNSSSDVSKVTSSTLAEENTESLASKKAKEEIVEQNEEAVKDQIIPEVNAKK